jgi:hypothetical protein
MLLLSPMSSPAHFGLLLLPGFCLARLAVYRKDRVLRAMLAAAILTTLPLQKDLVRSWLYTRSLELGLIMWVTIFLLIGCLVGLRRMATGTSAASAAGKDASPPQPYPTETAA